MSATTRQNRGKQTTRLTEKEWRAIYIALEYCLAGEDPWDHEVPKGSDEPSPTLKAVVSARNKIRARAVR